MKKETAFRMVALDNPGNRRIVVIGAGPAGLAAAYELTRLGYHPDILEMSAVVGGIARTEFYQACGFDIGGHRFFTQDQRINRLWHQMIGADFLKVDRISRIYYQGRFIDYPLNIANTLKNLKLIDSWKILSSYLAAQINRQAEEQNFEQWVVNRFGHHLFNIFFKAYTEKVWGRPCDQIKSEWAAQRIKGMSLVTVFTNTLFNHHNNRSLIRHFNYPLKGPGQMWQAFKRAIEAGGGRFHFETKVTALETENQRIIRVVCDQKGARRVFSSPHVISSMPIGALPGAITPKPPRQVIEASQGLSYRALIMVGLIIPSTSLFPDQWLYIHTPQVKVGRIQNFKNWSPAMVPDDRVTTLGMEYFCNQGDRLWRMDNAELTALAKRELQQLGLSRQGAVENAIVIRQPNAYPVYDHAFADNLDIIRTYLSTINNLQTIGRNGLHRYNNMDHSMLTGLLAADNIEHAQHNLWEVNDKNRYLESTIEIPPAKRLSGHA